MKWQLSSETSDLIHKLYDVERRRSWLKAKSQNATIWALLQQITAKDEIGAIAIMPRFLLSGSSEIRMVAGQAIAHLLSIVRPEELLFLDKVSDWSWCWTDGKKKIHPAMVQALANDKEVCSSILGLTSFHHNGYVRHEAVRLLADIHDGSELPYLLVRQNDWVEPISQDAHAVVLDRIVDEYLVHFVYNMPLLIRLLSLKRHNHSKLVYRIIEMLVQPRHEKLLTNVLHSSDKSVRQCVAKMALDIDGEHQDRIVKFGITSDDPVLRTWSCRLIRRFFSDEEAKEIFRQLKQDRFHVVRNQAYQGDAECQPNKAVEIWKEALLDSSCSVREFSQWYLSKLGVKEITVAYRDALAQNSNSLPALLGLGEVGDKPDIPVIRNYLKSPLPSRRHAAIRGLARIGSNAITGELVECIRDDSPSVTRKVRQLLEKMGAVLNGESLLAIVNSDSRLHCRLEAIRLMFGMSKWRSLPWLIRSAGHSDQETADLARSFIEAWFSPPLCNNIWTKPSNAEKEAIKTAIFQFSPSSTLLKHFEDLV